MPKPPEPPPAPPAPEPIAEAPEAIAARRAAEFRAAAAAAAAAEPRRSWTPRTRWCGARSSWATRGAVDACVAAGRHADALVLASVGGAELWEETRAAHIAANAQKPYMRVAKAVVSDDLGALVASRSLAKWRETLAILCTYAPAEEWGALAGVLAGRLAAAGDAHAATLCNVCAGDVDAAVGHWLGALRPGRSPSALLGAREGGGADSPHRPDHQQPRAARRLVRRDARIAGTLDDALSYLDMVPDGGEASPRSATAVGGGELRPARPPAAAYQAPAAAPYSPAAAGTRSRRPPRRARTAGGARTAERRRARRVRPGLVRPGQRRRLVGGAPSRPGAGFVRLVRRFARAVGCATSTPPAGVLSAESRRRVQCAAGGNDAGAPAGGAPPPTS